MTEHRIGDITIRPFDAERDSKRVRVIVGEIWGGGDDALMEKQFGIIGGRPWSEWMAQAVLGYLAADGTRSFVAERDGDMIGFCSYVIDDARKRGTVGYNGVARDHQGRGIGSAMLDFVMSRIRAEGMEYAAVIVADNEEHAPARRNYEKHGFRRLTGLHYMVQKL
ncbi:MAG: GNAT family N-acetyltransferase [Armatimonadota bacterium]|nr:MAG: GNAT family N-acetyltransferase [Armatimonadota bacterium]